MTSEIESVGRAGNIKTRVTQFIPFIGLILIILFFQFVSRGQLLTIRNSMAIINQLFSIALGATGAAFVMAQGNVDLSMGAIVGITAALAARAAGLNILLILPVALLVGALIGVINGFFHAYLNLQSLISTLAMSFVLRGLTVQILGEGSLGVSSDILKIDNIYVKLAVLFIVLSAGFISFEYTTIGKRSKAIGSQIEVAKRSGVNIRGVKVTAFVLTGMASGLVGFFSIVRTCTVSTSTGNFFEFDVLSALLVGGMPFMGGANAKFRSVLIGSLIMAVLSIGMTLWGLDMKNQLLIKGIIFLIAVSLTFDRRNTSVIQ